MIATNPRDLVARQGFIFYMPLAVFLVFFLLLANIMVQKLIVVGFLILTIGDFIYPLTYMCDGVLTEVYGYALSRRVIWMALFCNVALVFTIWIAVQVTPAPFWHDQSAFATVLGRSARIAFSSLTAFLFGEFLNAYLFARLKVYWQGKMLLLRAFVATAVSQALDTILFTLLAFLYVLPRHDFFVLLLSVYGFKVIYEIVVMPIIYYAARFLKRKEQIDIYDRGTNFNPFHIKLS